MRSTAELDPAGRHCGDVTRAPRFAPSREATRAVRGEEESGRWREAPGREWRRSGARSEEREEGEMEGEGERETARARDAFESTVNGRR